MPFKINDIYNVDSYEAIKEIPDKSIDLIITDPPYMFPKGGKNTGIFAKHGASNQNLNIIEEMGIGKGINYKILDEFVRVMKKINIYIWCNKTQLYDYMNFFIGQKHCVMDVIVWCKTNPTPLCSNKYLTDKEYCLFFKEKGVPIYGNYYTKTTFYVGKANVDDKKLYKHPTIKPINIIRNLLLNSISPTERKKSCGVRSIYRKWYNSNSLQRIRDKLYRFRTR